MQGCADLVGELGQQLIPSAPGNPVQFGAHIEQCDVGVVQRARRQVPVGHAVAVDELGEGQRVQQLHVAKTAATVFQVGLGPLGDSAITQPSRIRHFDELVHPGTNRGAPLPSHPGDQLGRKPRVARDVARFQHAQRSCHVGIGDIHRPGDGPHAVVQPNVGIPQRVPQPIGDLSQLIVRFVVVHQY